MPQDVGMSDLTTIIETAAENPKTVKSDGTEVTQHSLREVIEADQHTANQTAAARRVVPIGRFNTRPPGAV